MPGARSGRHICRAAGGQEYKDHIRAARGQPADIKHDPAQPAACSLVTGGEEIMGQVVTSCNKLLLKVRLQSPLAGDAQLY